MGSKHWIYIITLLVIIIISGCRGKSTDNADSTGESSTPVAVQVVGGLQEPVSLVFLSDEIMLVAERRAGRIRWIERGRLRTEPFTTVEVPTMTGYNEAGLLGLAVDPDYPAQPYVYAFHTVPDAAGKPASQRIVRFTVRNGSGVEPRTIVGNLPVSRECCHFGGRILFGPDGKLYATIGDTQQQDLAQDYASLAGKVLRYNPDGTIPTDNPFEPQTAVTADDAPSRGEQHTPVYTIGHRNPFGIASNPDTNEIYITENGPDHDDEINRLVGGDNYGWPIVMGYSNDPRFRSPLWATGRTTIAPTGAVFYRGREFSQFRGNLLFANYKDGHLRRAIFTNPDHISAVEVITQAGNNARLDVALSPGGQLYFSSMTAIYRLRQRE